MLFALAWLGGEVEQRTPNGSSLNLVAMGVLFLGAIGLLMAVIMAIVALAKAAFTRTPSSAAVPNEELKPTATPSSLVE